MEAPLYGQVTKPGQPRRKMVIQQTIGIPLPASPWNAACLRSGEEIDL